RSAAVEVSPGDGRPASRGCALEGEGERLGEGSAATDRAPFVARVVAQGHAEDVPARARAAGGLDGAVALAAVAAGTRRAPVGGAGTFDQAGHGTSVPRAPAAGHRGCRPKGVRLPTLSARRRDG